MGSKSDDLSNRILDQIVNDAVYTQGTTVYSALFTIIPSDTTGGTEVTNTATGYTRVATTFCSAGATSPGQVVNTAAVTFATSTEAYTVVGWGLMDAITAGNVAYWATVTTLAIGIGDQATFGIGAIVITED